MPAIFNLATSTICIWPSPISIRMAVASWLTPLPQASRGGLRCNGALQQCRLAGICQREKRHARRQCELGGHHHARRARSGFSTEVDVTTSVK